MSTEALETEDVSLLPQVSACDLGQVDHPGPHREGWNTEGGGTQPCCLGPLGPFSPLTTAAWFPGLGGRSDLSSQPGRVGPLGSEPAWQPRAAPGVRVASLSPGMGGLTQGPQLPPAPTTSRSPSLAPLCPWYARIPHHPLSCDPTPFLSLHTGGGQGPENWPPCLPHSSDID